MRIQLTNALARVWGDDEEIKWLDDATSYPLEDAQFSPAFKAGVWDGREHLLRKARNDDHWLIPSGLLVDVEGIDKVEFIDSRRGPGEQRELKWIGPTIRPYQLQTVQAALRDRGLFTGRGLLNLPIRSGKTVIAAMILRTLGLRALFVVPSDMLLEQTARSFEANLSPAPVAMLGGGIHKTDWITVATAQTLLARPRQAKQLLSEVDVLMVDEAHHLEGPAWRALLVQCDAPYKFGFSGSMFVSKLKQNNQASIWLKACTGPILHRVSMNRLIQAGYLMQPHVVFYRIEHKPDRRGKEWQWVARELLAQNPRRNGLIADLAANAARKGKLVLIDTGRHDQMKQLHIMLLKRGIETEILHGKIPFERRWPIIRRFQAREIQCIIGTVLGEGVDIPELEVVINAEGQKSQKAAIQRMRNLTPAEGKGTVHFVDIADIGNPILQKHSLQRLQLYKGMRGFKVTLAELGDPASDPFA